MFREVYDSVLCADVHRVFFGLRHRRFVLVLFTVCSWKAAIPTVVADSKSLGIFVGASCFRSAVSPSVRAIATLRGFCCRRRRVRRCWRASLRPAESYRSLLLRSRVTRAGVAAACVLVVLGGLAQMYVTLIGGQAYPQVLFPGMVESSSFFDGEIHPYTPSVPEILLGLGGVGLAAAIVAVALRALALLPERLDQTVGPQA
jgi:hypothetical protein